MSHPAPDVDYLEIPCRDLLCAMIQQAVEDTDPFDYKNSGKNALAAYNLLTSLEFIRSPFFALLCEQLNLPADKIRRRALQ